MYNLCNIKSRDSQVDKTASSCQYEDFDETERVRNGLIVSQPSARDDINRILPSMITKKQPQVQENIEVDQDLLFQNVYEDID